MKNGAPRMQPRHHIAPERHYVSVFPFFSLFFLKISLDQRYIRLIPVISCQGKEARLAMQIFNGSDSSVIYASS